MKWLPVISIVSVVVAFLTGYVKGRDACKEAFAKRLAETAVVAVKESQVNEDIIRAAPPSDDAPMAPVLARSSDGVRGK